MSVGTGSGLDAQIGIATQSEYDTYVAPEAFFEFNSEAIEPQVQRLESTPLGSGRFKKSSRVRHFVTGASGAIELDVVNVGMRPIFLAIFGDEESTQPEEGSQPNHWRHRYKPDSAGLRGQYSSVQVGRPSTDGTVQPFSYIGGKVTNFQFSAAMDEFLSLSTTWDFHSVSQSEPLGTPSYPADAQPYSFLAGTITMDGDPVGTVQGVQLGGEWQLATDRRTFGNNKLEPLANGIWTVTGQFDHEFEDMDAYNAWVQGAEQVDLVITFTLPGTEMDEGQDNPYEIVFNIPSLHYTGEAPTVSGPEIVSQNLPFEAAWNEDADILQVDYHNSEAGS